MAIFHYARISTDSQDISNQALQVEQAGFKVDAYYEDVGVSGTLPAMQRKGFKEMMAALQAGDTVITVEVSRIGRSTSDVLDIVAKLTKMNVKLRILNFSGIDLCSPMGELVLTVMAACATFERSLLVERTHAGLERAKSEGKVFGAVLKLPPESLQQAYKWIGEKVKHEDIAHRLNIGVATLYNLKKNWMNSEESLCEYKKHYEKQQIQIAISRRAKKKKSRRYEAQQM